MTTIQKALIQHAAADALGVASMAWNPMPTGTFNAVVVSNAADTLLARIETILAPERECDQFAGTIEIPEPLYGKTIRCRMCDLTFKFATNLSGRCPLCGEQSQPV